MLIFGIKYYFYICLINIFKRLFNSKYNKKSENKFYKKER